MKEVSRSFHVEVGKNGNLAYTKTITFKDLWPNKEKFDEARERILAECKLNKKEAV